MKRMMVIALAGALLAVAWPGYAQQPGRHADFPRPARTAPPPGRDMRNGGAGQQSGAAAHLTPEERRQLRRDISDHGRDIYRDPSKKR